MNSINRRQVLGSIGLSLLAYPVTAPLFTSPLLAGEDARPTAIAELPTFRHQGVV